MSGVARMSVKAWLRDKKRDRHQFDSDLIDMLASCADELVDHQYERRKGFLRGGVLSRLQENNAGFSKCIILRDIHFWKSHNS